MKKMILLIAVILATFASIRAQADVIKFDATGVAGISGFIEFDANAVASGFGFVQNTAITGLSLTVFTEIFDLGDVVTSAYTFLNIFVAPPTIVNGSGLLADNGTLKIFFYPDGANGTPSDGDAALASVLPDFSSFTVLPVRWVVHGTAPEPATLALLGLGLIGLGFSRRKQ